MIKRREFIGLLGGAATAAAWPLAARAQQRERMRRIGVLISITDDPEMRSRLAAFRQALQEMHWIEGRNLQTDLRFTDADARRAQIYAAELVGLNPDVLIAHTPQALRALLQVTRSIPIVFLQVPDPVEFGVVVDRERARFVGGRAAAEQLLMEFEIFLAAGPVLHPHRHRDLRRLC